MEYVVAFFILSFIGIIYMLFEATWVEKKITYISKNHNLKIIQLSDIHINFMLVSKNKIKKIIADENPDIILLTGDYIETEKNIPKFLEFIKYIGFKKEIFACFGNHDEHVYLKKPENKINFIRKLKDINIQILENENVSYEKNNIIYKIIGIGDIRHKKDNIEKALLDTKKEDVKILLCHNPDGILKLKEEQINYMFSGHFHGGQITIPFKIEFYILRKEILCREGIVSGHHRVNNIDLYINRGLGNVLFPFRFLSRPEISIIYI